MNYADYMTIMTVLNIIHYIVVPWGVIVCLRELFPTQSWAQIPVNFSNWFYMAVLLYVMKML
jgi:hypothetical protein